MSQTATIYRIANDTFTQLESANGEQQLETSAKNYAMFQGSHMALEYMLSKEQDEETIELVAEIFNPKQSLGEPYPEDMPEEEMYESFESAISYLDPATISRINKFLEKVSAADIDASYNAEELNDNGVYLRSGTMTIHQTRHIIKGNL